MCAKATLVAFPLLDISNLPDITSMQHMRNIVCA
jgi:hypothetical protein